MIRVLLLLLLVPVPVAAAEWPTSLGREGECLVCTRRGGEHGAEHYVDWRVHEGEAYGFCSQACADAFDQMPAGYVPPVLPRPAPDFRWTTLEGAEIRSDGSTALLVDFWATWCAPCLEAIPALEDLDRDFGEEGLQVVGVSIDEDRKTLENYLERRAVAYPLVHDGGEDPAWWSFRVPAIPAAFLLNTEGEIVAQWSGRIDMHAVRGSVRSLLDAD
jgi:thiol-disulfide isomerase/thioredoxin